MDRLTDLKEKGDSKYVFGLLYCMALRALLVSRTCVIPCVYVDD